MQIQLTKEQAEYLKRILEAKADSYHYRNNSPYRPNKEEDNYEHNKTLLAKVNAELKREAW